MSLPDGKACALMVQSLGCYLHRGVFASLEFSNSICRKTLEDLFLGDTVIPRVFSHSWTFTRYWHAWMDSYRMRRRRRRAIRSPIRSFGPNDTFGINRLICRGSLFQFHVRCVGNPGAHVDGNRGDAVWTEIHRQRKRDRDAKRNAGDGLRRNLLDCNYGAQ